MSKGDNRLKILYIIDELKNKSDENHYIKTSEIIEELNNRGLTADRKSIYNYIESLIEYGMDIEKSKKGYKLVSRTLELAELKMIADALGASRCISPKKTKDIVRKLGKITSEYNRSKLDRQVYIEDMVKSSNSSVIYNIDAIYNAVSMNKKISFNYLKTTVDFDEKEKIHKDIKRNAKNEPIVYVQSPYALLWKNENYYLLAYDSDIQGEKTFRVDRMLNVETLRNKRDGERYFTDFDTSEFVNTAFSMFGGEYTRIELKVKKELIGVILDRFGNDMEIYEDKNDSSCFLCNPCIQKSNLFFSWISGFGNGIELRKPENLRSEYLKYLENIIKVYQ